jgi:hypothetical protein
MRLTQKWLLLWFLLPLVPPIATHLYGHLHGPALAVRLALDEDQRGRTRTVPTEPNRDGACTRKGHQQRESRQPGSALKVAAV